MFFQTANVSGTESSTQQPGKRRAEAFCTEEEEKRKKRKVLSSVSVNCHVPSQFTLT